MSRRNGGVAWTWGRGDEVDFGAPELSGAALCIYDEATHELVVAAEAGPGSCGAKPCWKAAGRNTIYRGAKGQSLGSIALHEGSGNKAVIKAKAKGVPLLSWQPIAAPLNVQLKIADRCWESTFQPQDVHKNTYDAFVARGGVSSPAR